MAAYRAAIIGCGRIAHAHVRGYRAQADVEVVACTDVSPEAVQAFGQEFGIPGCYLALEEMLEREKPDVVSVCTHHPLHAPIVLAVAPYRPRAILCEKPIALTLPDADAMIAACAASNTLLVIGHQRRFGAQYVATKRALEGGRIGDVTSIEAIGHPGSSLLVDGTHTIDLVRFFLDDQPAAWVIGQIDDSARRHGWGHPVETAAFGWIAFDGKLEGLQRGVTGPNYHRIVLRGTKGELVVGGDGVEEGQPFITIRRGAEQEEVALPWPVGGDALHLPPFAEEIRVMLRCLEDGTHHPLAAESARATLEILLAMYESARRRGVVHLPLATADNPLFDLRQQSEPESDQATHGVAAH
ncbi:MAG: Gfo/Idh/MocA family oxidoreductase [Chloroflexi bacterium]|nr:Gfo/Idh/MocA family oxidoreductase [Chloroflexota bacterium]